jgi:hypothetical protein
LFQQLIGPVEQVVVLVPDIKGIARCVDSREQTAAMRANDFFAMIFLSDFQRSAADGALLQKNIISRH